MSADSLEERIARLEEQVSALISENASNGSRSNRPGRDDWLTTAGMFDGDPVMEEIIAETLKVRDEDRKRTRP